MAGQRSRLKLRQQPDHMDASLQVPGSTPVPSPPEPSRLETAGFQMILTFSLSSTAEAEGTWPTQRRPGQFHHALGDPTHPGADARCSGFELFQPALRMLALRVIGLEVLNPRFLTLPKRPHQRGDG
jgi:hypothetical protein